MPLIKKQPNAILEFSNAPLPRYTVGATMVANRCQKWRPKDCHHMYKTYAR